MTTAIIVTVAAFLLFWGGLNAFMGWLFNASARVTVLVSLAQLVVIAIALGISFGLTWIWSGVPS